MWLRKGTPLSKVSATLLAKEEELCDCFIIIPIWASAAFDNSFNRFYKSLFELPNVTVASKQTIFFFLAV
jgi:hypothetical protein